MAEIKEFPIAVVLCLTTGYELGGGFDRAHEAMEHVLGHPIWTHEMAECGLWDRLREAVLAQHPNLGDAEAFAPGSKDRAVIAEYLRGYIARAEAQFGKTLPLARGAAERTESPLASLERVAKGKPIIGVVVKE
jgi:hypothetical protein